MHRILIITHAVWVSHSPLMYTIAGLFLACLVALIWLILTWLWTATSPVRAWLGHHLQPVPEAVQVVQAGRSRGGSIASPGPKRGHAVTPLNDEQKGRIHTALYNMSPADRLEMERVHQERLREAGWIPGTGGDGLPVAEVAPKPAADPWPNATDRVMPARRVLPATTAIPVVLATPVEPAPKRGWLADHLDRPAKHEGATLTSITPIAELAAAAAQKDLTPTEQLDGRRIALDNGAIVGILETPPEGAILADVQAVLDPVGDALTAFRDGVNGELERFGRAVGRLRCGGYLVDEVPTETWDASELRARIAAEDAA